MRTIAFASKKDHGKTCCVNRVTPPRKNWSFSTNDFSFAVIEYNTHCVGFI